MESSRIQRHISAAALLDKELPATVREEEGWVPKPV